VTFGLGDGPGVPSAPITHPYQQPTVSESPSGKRTELHRYFTKILPDGIYNYHVISTTIEVPGKKPQVTHVVEVKRTDTSGRVTTKVIQHGDELGWHAGKSKWSAAPVHGASSSGSLALATATTSGYGEQSSPSVGKGTGFGGIPSGFGTSGPQAWQPIPEYYYTQLEALKGVAVTGKPPLRLTQDFMNATRKVFGTDATTNMLYGAWYME
jgi:hypothetical protein